MSIKIPFPEEEAHACDEDKDEEIPGRRRPKKTGKKGPQSTARTGNFEDRDGTGDRSRDPVHGLVGIEDLI